MKLRGVGERDQRNGDVRVKGKIFQLDKTEKGMVPPFGHRLPADA